LQANFQERAWSDGPNSSASCRAADAQTRKEKPMADHGSLSMTRRCFFAAAGLAVAAPATARAEKSSADTTHLPKAVLLSDGDVKTYLLVFHTGQEVMHGLVAFARKHKLVGGHLTGIRAIKDAVIGYFDPQKKIYLRYHIKEQAEVLSLTGNLALYKKDPFFHVHAALSSRDGAAHGGHVFEATVRPTVEIVLTASPRTMRRKIDPDTGLPLLDP
jgi:predicted DNA-binding protein with PD1-like motif